MANQSQSQPTADNILFDNSGKSVSDIVDQVFQYLPSGRISTAIGDSFYGINHRQQPGAININRDMHGLTFFTRPRMNLTDANIRAVRQLTPLLTKNADSVQRIIRCLLDPELAKTGSPITSQFVDDQQAFIPVLTNHLLSCSGWPDLEAPTFTSHDGIYREAFSMVDGVVRNFTSYEVTANFRNIPGDPITLMFLVWLFYMENVYLGEMVPYPDALINNEIDYMTRIYRVVLDPSKSYVQKIGACGAAFPTSCPIGSAFNFDAEHPLVQNTDQISVSFRCTGAMYQDDILIDEFNRTTVLFNDAMSDSQRTTHFIQVPMAALSIFNYRGYPRIDPFTYELQWWVDKSLYQSRLGYLTKA